MNITTEPIQIIDASKAVCSVCHDKRGEERKIVDNGTVNCIECHKDIGRLMSNEEAVYFNGGYSLLWTRASIRYQISYFITLTKAKQMAKDIGIDIEDYE